VGAGEAVLDDLLAKLVTERRVAKDGIRGRNHAVAAAIGVGHLSPNRHGDDRWLSGRRRDQHDATQSVRTSGGEQLCDLAAHAVSDQDVVGQAQAGDDGLRIIGEVADRVSGLRRAGLSPAAVIDRDAASRAASRSITGCQVRAEPPQ
jgi:hypothetical protein